MVSDFVTPEWVKDAIFYQIFPDRFAFSPKVVKPANLEAWDTPPTSYGFKGGDLQGVAERMDYVQDLGISAIYFTPIFQSAANHRYHTHDYFRVDPILGGDVAFRAMLNEAHRRGIRVILDGVFNHASRGFLQFNHALENGPASPYLDWFRVRGFPLHAYEGKPNYDCWVGLPALPEFNTQNPQVRDFIFRVARYWLDQGIDGWRLDVPFCIDDDSFWQEFRQVVKSANPQAYITGEIVSDASRWLQGDQFDGVMNYLLAYACWRFFAGEQLNTRVLAHWIRDDRQPIDAPAFAREVEHLLVQYPAQAVAAQLNLLDSHDTPRFVTIASGNRAALRLAALFQMTYPGAPCVYYGDEIGMEGGMDPDCRGSFPWDPARWDQDLRAYYQRLIDLRKRFPALRRGEFVTLLASGGLVAYLRQLGDEKMIVALNRSPQSVHLDLPVEGLLEEGRSMQDLLSGQSAIATQGRLVGIHLPPQTGVLLA